MRLPALLAVCLGLAGCVTQPGPTTPRTVAAVDLDRYVGRWYEIGRFPVSFQDGPALRCADVTADYTRRADGGIAVVNRCRNALGDGAGRAAAGEAYVVAGSNGARLRVSFFWPFYGDYWVLGLDPAYRWALVGAPDRDYLWLLARTPTLPDAERAAALAIARREGFAVDRLRWTEQSGAAAR